MTPILPKCFHQNWLKRTDFEKTEVEVMTTKTSATIDIFLARLPTIGNYYTNLKNYFPTQTIVTKEPSTTQTRCNYLLNSIVEDKTKPENG